MGKVRILVVEDYPEHLNTLVSTYNTYGAYARGAATGDEGLKIALEWQPQLIICNGLLEGMNAWVFWNELLHEYLKRGHSKPYCVTLTGSLSRLHISLSEECGADEYSGKPVVLSYLLELIKKARTREKENMPALVGEEFLNSCLHPKAKKEEPD